MIDRIIARVATVSYRVIVNGARTDRIIPSSGIRQGDPLSPYLYILFGAALTRSIMALSYPNPAYFPAVAPRGDKIPILRFADDTLLFIRANRRTASAVTKVLDVYGCEAGQQLNNFKSQLIFSKNTALTQIRQVKAALGIWSVTDAFT